MSNLNIFQYNRSLFLSGHASGAIRYLSIGRFRWLKIIVIVYLTLGIVFYFLQDKFLFHPAPLPADYAYHFDRPFSEVNIPINKNEIINLVKFFPKDSVRKGVVLFFHGNMENINRYAKFADIFTNKGYEVWMPDYPGFGKSTGELTEKKLYQVASLTYTLANAKYTKDNIVIYGKSLGTGIASQLASVNNCRVLILETPYYSIPDLFSYYVPLYPTGILSKYKIPVYEYLHKVKAHVIIFHGTADEVIPYRCAVKLKSALKETDEFISIPGGQHNNLNNFDVVQKKINTLPAIN
ncbi:MAG: alpha/beta fold hydrolase [Ginsengibacter sp.]